MNTRARRFTDEVLERDEYTCQNCGANTCLDAAHIIARSQAPRLKYNSTNGVTLCRRCHRFFTDNPTLFAIFVDRRTARP